MKRLAALVPNILGVSPGQRVRIETWAEHLRGAGWVVEFYPFEDENLHHVLYGASPLHVKAARIISCYKNQLKLILRAPACDVLLIFREAALIGPAILERLAARWRVPIIYDFDDPVFLSYRSPMNGWFSLLKFPKKTHALFRMSDHIIAINSLLANYAARFNSSISVIPNCVDIERYRPLEHARGDGPVRLVWMGSHSTMPNLEALTPILRRLQGGQRVVLRVIGSGSATVTGLETEVRQWTAASEVADLQDCDVGLVPLPDHPWHPWKLFFKTVQYMAVGLPVVARRMGSNGEIIEDGVNGFLVDTDDEWYDRLQLLINDSGLRKRMGEAARSTVVERYSTQVQMPRMVSIFEEVLKRSRAGSNHLAKFDHECSW